MNLNYCHPWLHDDCRENVRDVSSLQLDSLTRELVLEKVWYGGERHEYTMYCRIEESEGVQSLSSSEQTQESITQRKEKRMLVTV